MRAMPHICELYPGICLTTEEKARKNLSQGSRRVPVGTMKIHKHTKRTHRHNNKKYINYNINVIIKRADFFKDEAHAKYKTKNRFLAHMKHVASPHKQQFFDEVWEK